ncbi:MAG: sodium:dicarboxylate symporter [Alphaproteobacteria bacterium]|nr:sodium:dicarboxylate symporter [Alphaproteobacteria bacterium]
MLRGMTGWVLGAMLLGIAVGLVLHAAVPDKTALSAITGSLGLLATIFLRAIRMILAPLVFSTLLTGVGRIRESAAVGRIALRAMIWFVVASVAAILVALAAAALLHPGTGMTLAAAAGAAPAVAPLTLAGFIGHLVPTSIVQAMAENEILQIVIFALVAGVALGQMGEKGEPVLRLAEAVSQLMLKMTGYVMYLAPLAVFAAVAVALAEQGIEILARYGAYVGGFYVVLAVIWLLLMTAGAAILGTGRLKQIMTAIRQPALIAFTTASSEAVYPSLLAKLEENGVPNRIAALVLPLGYSFNLVGSMCYCTWAVMFLLQAYGIAIPGWTLAQLLFLLFVLSKGIAGVPRAGILVVTAAAPYFHIPEAGILLILGVDHFVDMGRTATNAVANGLAAASVAKWETK